MTTVGASGSYKTTLAQVQLVRAALKRRSPVREVGSLLPAEGLQSNVCADGVRPGSDV